MHDQIRGLKTEIEENLRGIDEDIALRSDGDVAARNSFPIGRGHDWPSANPGRWKDVRRDYAPADVAKLTGSIQIHHTLAELGAAKLWRLLHTEDYVATIGAFTGNQAVQHAKAGLKAIYLSGWQVAADANSAGAMYPDQSLYPVDSV